MEEMFEIDSFSNGINEYVADGLMKPNEATNAKNCDIGTGSLKTVNEPNTLVTAPGNVGTLMVYHNKSGSKLVFGVGSELRSSDTIYQIVSGRILDSLNFEYKGDKVLVCCSNSDVPIMISGEYARRLKNRRKVYGEDGSFKHFVDGNGGVKDSEELVVTLAPKGDFLELHYDRLWIAGDSNNPDRLYFSTAGVNGADIEDWTMPIEEAEANQHGGFIDIRSYDGSKIIGLKVVFNALVVFKDKSAYKVFGDNPGNYEIVQLFSSNGAIANKSICTGNNGAFFLNNDGIYFYDGTNTNLISQKLDKTFKSMNKSYSSNSAGYFFNNKYYLAIPTGSSTTNNVLVIYDTLTNSFVKRDVSNLTSFAEYNKTLIYSTGNLIKTMDTGTVPMDLIWESPQYDFGKKNSRKNTNYIYFRGKGSGSVIFTLSSEKKTKTLEIPLTNVETVYKKKLKVKGRMFKLVIKNKAGSTIEITNPQVSTEIDTD